VGECGIQNSQRWRNTATVRNDRVTLEVPPRYWDGLVTSFLPKRHFICQLLMYSGARFAPETNLRTWLIVPIVRPGQTIFFQPYLFREHNKQGCKNIELLKKFFPQMGSDRSAGGKLSQETSI
jgi:hypothetical protein